MGEPGRDGTEVGGDRDFMGVWWFWWGRDNTEANGVRHCSPVGPGWFSNKDLSIGGQLSKHHRHSGRNGYSGAARPNHFALDYEKGFD